LFALVVDELIRYELQNFRALFLHEDQILKRIRPLMISSPIFEVFDTVDPIRNGLFAGSEKRLVKRKKEHFGDIQYVFPNRETTPAQFEGRSAFEYDMDDTFQKFYLEKSFSLV
jgi:hypothetical protein